jgi:hypothetical protein
VQWVAFVEFRAGLAVEGTSEVGESLVRGMSGVKAVPCVLTRGNNNIISKITRYSEHPIEASDCDVG